MDFRLIVEVLLKRSRLKRNENLSRPELLILQKSRLDELRAFAYARSSFYKRFHKGLERAPLHELPVLTKKLIMENFDEIITDPNVKLSALQKFIENVKGDERFDGRYWFSATSGTTGRKGIFVYNREEWTSIMTSYARSYQWAGMSPNLNRRIRMAIVSSRSPLHQSYRVGLSAKSPFTPTLQIDSLEPLEQISRKLNEFKPDSLIGYAGMLGSLAHEQLAGRLSIKPRAIISASEVLTHEARKILDQAWGSVTFNVYGATETATVASECDRHRGLHLMEDLLIPEVVDSANNPTPVAEFGDKILVTVLFSKTIPLIRYEMSDSVKLSADTCLCGRPFRLISEIQGRQEDVIRLKGIGPELIALQPNLFHKTLEKLPLRQWQVVQLIDGLLIKFDPIDEKFDSKRVEAVVNSALADQSVRTNLTVTRTKAFDQTIVGKTPLIKALR